MTAIQTERHWRPAPAMRAREASAVASPYQSRNRPATSGACTPACRGHGYRYAADVHPYEPELSNPHVTAVCGFKRISASGAVKLCRVATYFGDSPDRAVLHEELIIIHQIDSLTLHASAEPFSALSGGYFVPPFCQSLLSGFADQVRLQRLLFRPHGRKRLLNIRGVPVKLGKIDVQALAGRG